jgi:hypothetical protein
MASIIGMIIGGFINPIAAWSIGHNPIANGFISTKF